MPFSSKTASRSFSFGLFLLAFLFSAWNIPLKSRPPALAAAPHSPNPSTAASAQLLAAYARLPLSFEVNHGRAGSDIQFVSRGPGLAIFLDSRGAAFLTGRKDPPAPSLLSLLSASSAEEPATSGLPASHSSHFLRMSLLGARPGSQGVGVSPLPGKANYFIGDDPKNWQTNLDTYAKVKFASVYPGIDLLYYGNQQRLEYDFIVAPGSSPSQIHFALEGADRVRIDSATGDLVLLSGPDEIRIKKPLIYQFTQDDPAADGATRHFIDGNYTLEAGNHIAFNVSPYDSSKPLVIDPVLSFFTYLGGMLPDVALHVAADATGVYVTGATLSPDFPHSASAFSTSLKVGICGPPATNTSFPCPDVFVTKLKPDGTGVLYSTYLGGTRSDIGLGIAVDSNQQAYIVGETESTDFPTTPSGFESSVTGRLTRAFLTKLNSAGSQLMYSTFLGGTLGSRGVGNDPVNDTVAAAVAVDNAGHAYLSGYTRSNSLPTTSGVVQRTAGLNSGPGGIQCHSTNGNGVIPCSDGFVAKFDTTALNNGSLIYSTYLGGSYYDVATGIAIDSNGNAYVTGATLSDDFPVVAAFQPSRKPGRCGPTRGTGGGHVCASAFISKLDTVAATLIYSSYLGGGNGDTAALGIAIDPSKNVYITGLTNASDFPATGAVVQHALATASPSLCALAGNTVTCPDAFAAKISSTGSLSYATFLGGTAVDVGVGIAVDSSGNAYVAGLTNSTNFPTASPVQTAFGNGNCPIRIAGVSTNFACPDAFITKLDPAGATLLYSSYVGGSNVDFATGVALDTSNNVYVTGGTFSAGLATQGVSQSMIGSKGDAFVFKIAAPVAGPPFILQPAANNGSTSATVKAGRTATYNLQVTPANGFTGSITFTCAGAPPHATCNPPGSVNVAGTAPVPFTVTVDTMGASTLPPDLRHIPGTPRNLPLLPLAFLAFMLLVLAARKRLGLTRFRTPLLWAVVLFFATLPLLAGCGGNNSGGTTNTGTPPGTYTITVTGTSGATMQSIDLTLTVQ
jgi:hypothetical protein